MKKVQIVYVPIGVGTFDQECANEYFSQSRDLLLSCSGDIACPDRLLLDAAAVAEFLGDRKPDLVILQNVTFANAAYASEVLRKTDCPILLWTLREPAGCGGRLRLNALTGAFSAANAIRQMGNRYFEHVLGNPDEAQVEAKLRAMIAAVQLRGSLRELKIAQIGHTPQGFGFGRALDLPILRKFGVTLESIEAREMIRRANAVDEKALLKKREEARKRIAGLEKLPEKNVEDFVRLWCAYASYVEENGIGAIASRCWPDFFVEYGTPVCAVLAMLNDAGIPAGCEADTYGALSMYIAMQLTGMPTFFGDPVAIDEQKNSFTFWHCGTAACSLARADEGACAGVHCNRKIGPTMEFGCRPNERATVFRVGVAPNGEYRLFILKGSILDEPKQYFGTSMVVRVDGDVSGVLKQALQDGWEPHFAVAHGDIQAELEMLGHMLDIPVIVYGGAS